jgi:hypothetical protein
LPWIFILFFGDFFVDGDNVPVFRPFVSPRKMRHNKSTGSFILSLVWNAYKQWSCLPNDLQSHSQDFYCAAPRQTEEEHFLAAFLTAFASVDGNERYQQNPLVDKQFFFFQRRKWFCGTGFLLSLNFSAGRDWKKEIKVFQWNRVFDSFYTSKLILFSTFWSLEKKKRKKTGCAVCVIPISHEGWKSSCSSAAPRF